jgi:hypothetical protein
MGSENVRITALSLIKVYAKSLRKSASINPNTNTDNNDQPIIHSSVDICGKWILRSIEDESQEIAYAAFNVLREIICGDCVCHFHQEQLPITVSIESMKWIKFMCKHYSFLLSRVRCMDARRRYPALRPLTYISLLTKQEADNQETSIEHG